MKPIGTPKTSERAKVILSIIFQHKEISVYDLVNVYITEMKLPAASRLDWHRYYGRVAYVVKKLEAGGKISTIVKPSSISPLGKRMCRIV